MVSEESDELQVSEDKWYIIPSNKEEVSFFDLKDTNDLKNLKKDESEKWTLWDDLANMLDCTGYWYKSSNKKQQKKMYTLKFEFVGIAENMAVFLNYLKDNFKGKVFQQLVVVLPSVGESQLQSLKSVNGFTVSKRGEKIELVRFCD